MTLADVASLLCGCCLQVLSATMPFGDGPVGKKHPHFGHWMYPFGTIKQVLMCDVLGNAADAIAKLGADDVSVAPADMSLQRQCAAC